MSTEYITDIPCSPSDTQYCGNGVRTILDGKGRCPPAVAYRCDNATSVCQFRNKDDLSDWITCSGTYNGEAYL
ncbi:unnamed protein product [Sphagnum balticum]